MDRVMNIKKVISVLTVSALALCFTACRARERYLNAEESRIAETPLVCHEAFGHYYFSPGWTEIGSGHSHTHSYCLKTDLDNPDRPYSVTVTHETNEYSYEEGYSFANIEYPILTEEYGEDAVTMTGMGGINDTGFASFEIQTEDTHIYQWYILGDYEQVLFELTVEDEDYAQENCIYDDVDNTTLTFYFD